MSSDKRPIDEIERLAAEHSAASDEQLLAVIAALPPLADESDSRWSSEAYWQAAANPYLAMVRVVGRRRLRRAVRPLLERAANGDPGETMRGLRHAFEAIYKPDWSALADEYLSLARSPRLGTRLWAIAGLMVLDDPRAIPVFECSMQEDPEEIKWYAEVGLKRLLPADGPG